MPKIHIVLLLLLLLLFFFFTNFYFSIRSKTKNDTDIVGVRYVHYTKLYVCKNLGKDIITLFSFFGVFIQSLVNVQSSLPERSQAVKY